jgi:hypothetical protein
MNTLGLGKLDVFGLGTPGAVSTPEVVNDVVQELTTDLVWDIVVDTQGPEQKRKDYDRSRQKL